MFKLLSYPGSCYKRQIYNIITLIFTRLLSLWLYFLMNNDRSVGNPMVGFFFDEVLLLFLTITLTSIIPIILQQLKLLLLLRLIYFFSFIFLSIYFYKDFSNWYFTFFLFWFAFRKGMWKNFAGQYSLF